MGKDRVIHLKELGSGALFSSGWAHKGECIQSDIIKGQRGGGEHGITLYFTSIGGTCRSPLSYGYFYGGMSHLLT